MPPKDKSFYKVRCDYPGCNMLARHTPASDGKRYCKRHHPDLAKGIPPSPYAQPKPVEPEPKPEMPEPVPAQPEPPPLETIPAEAEPEPEPQAPIEVIEEEDDSQMLSDVTTTDDELTTNNEGDEKMNILNFGKDKKEEKHEEVAPQPAAQAGEPATLNLKLTIAELQADYLAHQFLIERTYQSYAALGLPQHLAQAEVERLVAPHRQRVADIEAILKKFSA